MFSNEALFGRLVVIQDAIDLYADISTNQQPGFLHHQLAGSPANKGNSVWIKPEAGKLIDRTTHNFPILLDEEYTPWNEANAYMLHLLTNKLLEKRPTDELRRIASKLLEFKIYCESESLDILNLSATRPAHRPTYRYFSYLQSKSLTPQVINQATGIIYKFYEYLSSYWYAIDMERVDKTTNLFLSLPGTNGKIKKSITKRSQTKRPNKSNSVPLGFIRDDGELLRPLQANELSELLLLLENKTLSAEHHYIVLSCLATGARKQTILTIRIKHLELLARQLKNSSGIATLTAGPGTGVDTKNDQFLTITFPVSLVRMLLVYKNSSNYKKRIALFISNYKKNNPELPLPNPSDQYLFISDKGNCFYMGKNDFRYERTKSPPTGQVTTTIKNIVFKHLGPSFSRDFKFHWLRATYAKELYKNLQPLVKDGSIAAGADITFIQNRLGHRSRVTTEHYLKLFKNESISLNAQIQFENHMFGDLFTGLE